MTIPLTDLASKLEEAKLWGRRALVLASGCSEVETFLSYRVPKSNTLDSGEVFLAKKSDVRSVLCSGMEHQGLCAPVHIKMGSGSFDWVKFCCSDFPAEVFSSALWTPAVAFEQKFISEGMNAKMDADPTGWKDFQLIITSNFGLDEA